MILDLNYNSFVTFPYTKVCTMQVTGEDKHFYIYNLTKDSEPFQINSYEPNVVELSCNLNEVELIFERLKYYSMAFHGDLIIGYSTERHGNQFKMKVSAVVSDRHDRKLTDIVKVLLTTFKPLDVNIQ